MVAGFLNIGFLIEGNPLCSRIRGTRTARAKRTKAPDGFLLRYIIFEVTQTQGPLRAAQREIKKWAVNHEKNIGKKIIFTTAVPEIEKWSLQGVTLCS